MELTEKWLEFIAYLRTELPYGECRVIMHGGEPDMVEVPKEKRKFGQKRIMRR